MSDVEESGLGEGGELFYRGTLLHFARGTGRGVVRSSRTGREVPFELVHVLVLGSDGDGGDPATWLREGLEVGYDVGWTSRGLRVTKIFPLRSEGASET